MDAFPVEPLLDYVLSGREPERGLPEGVRDMAGRVFHFDGQDSRVVILGGGTGMSTVVGGNAGMPDWGGRPFVGLKQVFPRLQVVVCTTDDGGSTGRLVRRLPMIGIGDLRKSLLSYVRREGLQRAYGLTDSEVLPVVCLIQQVFNHRFREDENIPRALRDPLWVLPPGLRGICPPELAAGLRALGGYVSPGGGGPAIETGKHCLGNLLLASALFRAAGGRTAVPPGSRALRNGLDQVARLIGAPPGRVHGATATPGELVFRYANGVEVTGQHKSSHARRGFAIDWMRADFTAEPDVPAAVLRHLREADLIIIAPGSLYTSNIALLQVPGIAEAIRSNRRALKILGANFWVQEGETDISPHNAHNGFLVSELIEAYDRNVAGGASGLFDVVLASNLEHLPGDILRNYALEGKKPIHLDRARVEAMGYRPVEAMLFAVDRSPYTNAVQHDPEKFAVAIRALLVADGLRQDVRLPPGRRGAGNRVELPGPDRRPLAPCRYMEAMRRELRSKQFEPAGLRDILMDLAWKNRDIQPEHARLIRAVRIVPASRWNRSVEWDSVLGYFDAEDLTIKLHASLLRRPAQLREDLVIALGEAVLGRYIEERSWSEDPGVASHAARCYSIRLLPPAKRRTFLDPAQLTRYLRLARMNRCPGDPGNWCITVNGDEGFLPPGLLFGLMYAWYLYNAWGGAMEYEMSLLHWPRGDLIPCQARERERKQALVDFFRTEVFRR
ncbi:MAG TPA: YvcK family protein [Kiritimatiellia bacterium]|nr:YvcK family protein [Kiritimatiellia bacterium]HSA18002.1 YvcK family protein [Kiritimatiellia bacterium]